MTLFQKHKEKAFVVTALIIIALFVSPLFILGENAHIRVHDNLDSNLAWYKVLKESGEIFGSLEAVIPQVMNGNLLRNAFGTEWSGIVWLHRPISDNACLCDKSNDYESICLYRHVLVITGSLIT